MPKNKPAMDSADYLAKRQGDIVDTIMKGIQAGGLTDEVWGQMYAWSRRLADRGHISERTRKTLRYFRKHNFYRNPRRLSQLLDRLEEDFDAAQRIYTMKGLLQLAPADEFRYESTLSGVSPMMDEAPDWTHPVEEEEK